MKKNQKGFSAVEAILILVIVGVIGGIGWFVFKQNQPLNKTAGTQNQSQQTETEWTDQPQAFDPKGDIVAENQTETIQKLGFTGPAGWQILTQQSNEWVLYYSPDFKGVRYVNGSSVTEGGEFSVSAYKMDEVKTIRQMAQEESISYFAVEAYTQIGKIEAVEGTCGHFGRATCIAAVYDGYFYQISYRQVDEHVKNSTTSENKYKKEFSALVASLKFK